MAKVRFEFNDEESNNVILCVSRHTLANMLEEINTYRRNLTKYEERNEIPTQEIIDNLENILQPWFIISEM